MADLLETNLLIAALNNDAAEAKRLIRSMHDSERRALQGAIFRLDDWIDDVDQDESERKLGMGVKDG